MISRELVLHRDIIVTVVLSRFPDIRRGRARTWTRPRTRTCASTRSDHRRSSCDILQRSCRFRTVGLQSASVQRVFGVSGLAVRVQELRGLAIRLIRAMRKPMWPNRRYASEDQASQRPRTDLHGYFTNELIKKSKIALPISSKSHPVIHPLLTFSSPPSRSGNNFAFSSKIQNQ